MRDRGSRRSWFGEWQCGATFSLGKKWCRSLTQSVPCDDLARVPVKTRGGKAARRHTLWISCPDADADNEAYASANVMRSAVESGPYTEIHSSHMVTGGQLS